MAHGTIEITTPWIWRGRMKRITLAAALILCVGTHAYASPFLVCDPQAGVEHYEVTGLPGDNSNVLPDATGAYGFKLDLATLAEGNYTVKARACNIRGCSAESSPFVFEYPRLLTDPRNYRLSK